MDLEAGASPALSGETPQQLQASQKPQAKSDFNTAFFVVVASSVTPDEPRQIVLPPPEPAEVDTTDWGFFWLGWVFALSWVVGVFRPLFRSPRFPQKQNFRGWVGNVIGTMLLVAVIVIVTLVCIHHKPAPECSSDLTPRQLRACCKACQPDQNCGSACDPP